MQLSDAIYDFRLALFEQLGGVNVHLQRIQPRRREAAERVAEGVVPLLQRAGQRFKSVRKRFDRRDVPLADGHGGNEIEQRARLFQRPFENTGALLPHDTAGRRRKHAVLRGAIAFVLQSGGDLVKKPEVIGVGADAVVAGQQQLHKRLVALFAVKIAEQGKEIVAAGLIKMLERLGYAALGQDGALGGIGHAHLGRQPEGREIPADQLVAERVDGADARARQAVKLAAEVAIVRTSGDGAAERRVQLFLHIRGRRLGEGDDEQAVDAPAADQTAQDALGEHGGLAAARARADQQAAVLRLYGSFLGFGPDGHHSSSSPKGLLSRRTRLLPARRQTGFISQKVQALCVSSSTSGDTRISPQAMQSPILRM